MLNWIEKLPVELVGTYILGYLSIKNIVRLERACGSKKSHQIFLDVISHRPPVALPVCKYTSTLALKWLGKRSCKINTLYINFNRTIEYLQPLLDHNIGCYVKNIFIYGNQNREVMEQLSVCTSNVEQLQIDDSDNYFEWLTVDILTRWSQLKNLKLHELGGTDAAMVAIAQHCSKLETLTIKYNCITATSLLALSERGLPLHRFS